jgi:hypothetical protein
MTTVKYFHHQMTGAPTLNGTAGALIAVLDACLVNGFGSVTLNSVTISGGIGTASISTSHPFEVDCIVALSGASTPAALNGQFRVLSVPNINTFTFQATGISDQTATGTIAARFAPCGWTKEFSATNLAVYRSPNVTGTREFLRVDDTSTSNARVVGYENMTDVNTGTGPFPTATQVSGGGFWPKANASVLANARGWTLIGNDKTFYLHTNTHSDVATAGFGGCVWGFGDFVSYKPGDAYACFLNCSGIDNSQSTGTVTVGLEYGSAGQSNAGLRLPRSFTAIGSAINALNAVESYQTNDSTSGSTAHIGTYPNGPDNGLFLTRKLVFEPSRAHLRGYLPGILHVAQNCHSSFLPRDKVDGQGVYANRKLLVVKTNSIPTSNTSGGMVMFDITGPWS